MKIRNGFVSNSSTSNFLIFGFKAPYKNTLDNDLKEFNKKSKLDLDCLYGVNNGVVIGKILFDIEDTIAGKSIDIDQQEFNELSKKVEEWEDYIQEVFGVNCIMHLIAGTREC